MFWCNHQRVALWCKVFCSDRTGTNERMLGDVWDVGWVFTTWCCSEGRFCVVVVVVVFFFWGGGVKKRWG